MFDVSFCMFVAHGVVSEEGQKIVILLHRGVELVGRTLKPLSRWVYRVPRFVLPPDPIVLFDGHGDLLLSLALRVHHDVGRLGLLISVRLGHTRRGAMVRMATTGKPGNGP